MSYLRSGKSTRRGTNDETIKTYNKIHSIQAYDEYKKAKKYSDCVIPPEKQIMIVEDDGSLTNYQYETPAESDYNIDANEQYYNSCDEHFPKSILKKVKNNKKMLEELEKRKKKHKKHVSFNAQYGDNQNGKESYEALNVEKLTSYPTLNYIVNDVNIYNNIKYINPDVVREAKKIMKEMDKNKENAELSDLFNKFIYIYDSYNNPSTKPKPFNSVFNSVLMIIIFVILSILLISGTIIYKNKCCGKKPFNTDNNFI